MKHILHVFPGFDVGGSQVRFAAVVAGLGEGYSHSVIALNGRHTASAHLDPTLDIQTQAPPELSGGFLKRIRAIRAKLDQLSPDLLVTYNWGAIEFAIANRGRATPHVHVEDGFGPEEAVRPFRRRGWIRRLALSRSELIAPSATLDRIATLSWRLNRRRVHWIPNGVADRATFATSFADVDIQIPPGRPVIAWVGAMRAEKNPIRALRAFTPLTGEAVLLMIGDGPERAKVQAEVDRLGLGADVRLLGYRTDARDFVMQSDILVLSSDTEQMPLAVLEAMDAGLPVVSTDVGDVRHMVAPLNHPFVAASEAGFSKALATMVKDAGLRARIGQANRAQCRDRYSLKAMLDAWRSLFARLTSSPI